jgi:hypothetical protein
LSGRQRREGHPYEPIRQLKRFQSEIQSRMRGDSDYLFRRAEIFDVRDHRIRQIEAGIDTIDRNQLLNSSIEDFVCYFTESFKLNCPRLHRDEATVDQREGRVQVHNVFEDRVVETTGTIIELTVPFEGDGNLFFVKPNTWGSMPPRAQVGAGALTISLAGRELQQTQVKRDLDQQLDLIEEYLGWLRADAEQFNASISKLARERIEQRRAKLLADQNLVSNLGFNLKKRTDAPKTYVAPITKKQIVPRLPPASTAPFKPEPTLAEEEYRSILDIMTNMALVMERSPTAFGTIDEEDLRQHFLVQLNGQYEGQATGETFNFQGKTDILIRVDGQNIFVAECKYWRGRKSYEDTIDQILSYLSWRDTKAAIVIFNRNNGFSNVLSEIQTTTKAHGLYKSGPAKDSDTRFRYIFGQQADPPREVKLTILAFDVPSTTLTT